MLRTMVRPEDTIKDLRSYRSETSAEDDMINTPESSFSSRGSSISESSSFEDEEFSQQTTKPAVDGVTRHNQFAPQQLTQEETIELTRRAVENGVQETKRSLAGNEAVSDVVRPKLTIDLGHSHIVQIPEAVVDIIKDEVER